MDLVAFTTAIKNWLVGLKINHSGKLLTYGDYFSLPAAERTADEQPVVDQVITAGLLQLLGYDASVGEVQYNSGLSGRESVPDYVIGIHSTGGRINRVFPFEDKNSTISLSELVGTHSSQVARYMKALATPSAMISNGRYVVGLTVTQSGNVDPIFTVDLLAVYTAATSTPPLFPSVLDAPIRSMYLRFCRESHTGIKPLLKRIGMHPLPMWKASAKPVDKHVDDFISDLSRQIELIHADSEAQLQSFIMTGKTATAEIDAALDKAAGPTLSAKSQMSSLCTSLIGDLPSISLPNISARVNVIREHIEKLATEPANNFYRDQVQSDLEELLASRKRDAFVVARRSTARSIIKLSEQMSEAKTSLELKYEKSLSVLNRFQTWYAQLHESLSLEDTNAAIKEFALQAAYVYVIRLLLIRICEDKGLLKRRPLSNGGFRRLNIVLRQYLSFSSGSGAEQLLSIAYDNAQHIYSHFYGDQTLFDWYTPDEHLFLSTLQFLNQYDFLNVKHDILGQVYERYAKTHGKKDEGRFYTKREIVDFMIDLAGIPSDSLIGKRLIDPASGSGTFLVRGAQHWIAAYSRGAHTPVEIINHCVNSLWGLDINPFACYLSETNLLIQFLDLIEKARAKDRSFPGISRFHIYNTNSLAEARTHLTFLSGSDVVDEAMVDAIKRREDYAGHDLSNGWHYVLANPPYGDSRWADSYASANRNGNLFAAFTDFGLKLVAADGRLCFITPTSWLNQDAYLDMRRALFSRVYLGHIVKCPYDMFDRAFVDNCIFSASAAPLALGFHQCIVECAQAPKREDEQWLKKSTITFAKINSSRWQADSKLRITLLPEVLDFLEHARVNAWTPLMPNVASTIERGIRTPAAAIILPGTSRSPNAREYFVTSNQLGTYAAGSVRRYALVHPRVFPMIDYQARKVEEFKDPSLFVGSRVLARRAISRQFRIQSVVERRRNYVSNKDLYVLKPAPGHDLEFVAGLLNSRLASYQVVNLSESAQKDDNTQVTQAEIGRILVPSFSVTDKARIARRARWLQLGATALVSLPARGIELRGIEGLGDHLAATEIIVRVKSLLRTYRSYDFLSAETAGRISVTAPAGRSFRITQWARTKNVFTFTRAKSIVTIKAIHKAVADYIELYLRQNPTEVYGSNADTLLRSATIPMTDADCAALCVERAKTEARVRSFLNRLLSIDREIDDIIAAASCLPKKLLQAVAKFPSSL